MKDANQPNIYQPSSSRENEFAYSWNSFRYFCSLALSSGVSSTIWTCNKTRVCCFQPRPLFLHSYLLIASLEISWCNSRVTKTRIRYIYANSSTLPPPYTPPQPPRVDETHHSLVGSHVRALVGIVRRRHLLHRLQFSRGQALVHSNRHSFSVPSLWRSSYFSTFFASL